MSFDRASTASAREFEDTAIKKLVAEGVPRHVAHAFVTLGIMKNSQQYERLRDVVCPMDFREFFIPTSGRDFTDPLRVGGTGALVPRVENDDTPRFFTQFLMTDIESVRFTKAFPELRIVNAGKVYNQHAYYANKRFAECELLIGMVHRHANDAGFSLDPRSVVDLGGNYAYHVKRDRGYVHAENPVLSGRDSARYTVREVFSDEDPTLRCPHRFQDCRKSFDYAIAVHSTYDMSPRHLASAMHKRGVSVLFGVINFIPGLELKKPGVYEADGLVATVVKELHKPPYAKFTFRYDTAVEYTHGLSDLTQYLYVERQYDFYSRDGSVLSYVYKIESVRGNSLIYSITRGKSSAPLSNTTWTPRRSKQYSLTIEAMGVKALDVDCELFDRLVLQAAGARNFEQYDIVALYRYAKSLRQRVSLNGIVLSSGFCMNPEELVYVVVAAYSVAAAYKQESVAYFKKATAQIMVRRGGSSFLRSVLTVAAEATSRALEGLGAIVGKLTFYTALDGKLKDMIRKKFPVEILVDKPHAGKGLPTMSYMLAVPPTPVKDTRLVRVRPQGIAFTPLAVDGLDPTLRLTSVMCNGESKRFSSYGIPHLGDSEKARDCKPVYHCFELDTSYPVVSEEYRNMAYGIVLRQVLGYSDWDRNPLVAPNGDRVFRRAPVASGELGLGPDSMGRFISPVTQYIVFRGVGSRAVSLGKPKVYAKGVCLDFILFYERDEDEYVDSKKQEALRRHDSSLPDYNELSDIASRAVTTREDWDLLLGRSGVKQYRTPSEARAAVQVDLDAGVPTMTGALAPGDTPPPSVSSTSVGGGPVYRTHSAARSVPGVVSEVAHSEHDSPQYFDWADDEESVSPSVFKQAPDLPVPSDVLPALPSSSSGDESYARNSLLEFIRACEASEQVVLESSASYIDMAVAVSRDEAPASRWGALLQGTPGDPVIVRVRGNEWTDLFTGEPVQHMAVSDGKEVFDRITNLPRADGVYVASRETMVYTGAAIKESVRQALELTYSCEVVSVNGVAGSGKTYQIVHEASEDDVVLCETRAALDDTLEKLRKRFGKFDNGSTVDSFLMHRQFVSAPRVWVDESFRLHAAKLFSVIRHLRPQVVFAFGDSKQIPVLPYVPKFDFFYHMFPFTRTILKRDTWRCPADTAMSLSQPQYYGFPVSTHNPVRRSMQGPLPYDSSKLVNKPPDVVLLVYSKSVRDDLKKQGVTNVMTIGQSQGCTFDDVVLFRDSDLKKVLYYDLEQTLVAVTRHRRSFTYITTAFASDDSAVSVLLGYLRAHVSDVVLASHYIYSDSDSEDPAVRVSPEDDGLFDDEEVEYL